MELRELVSHFGPRYCSLFCCTDDTTVSEDGELTLFRFRVTDNYSSGMMCSTTNTPCDSRSGACAGSIEGSGASGRHPA